MMFFSFFVLFGLTVAYRTSPLTSTVNKNPRNTGPPARTKLDIPEEYQHPAFCNGVECPKYRLGFEHREYDATKWVSTPVTLDDEGTEAAYINLFKYINGSNSEGMHLSITSPVVVSFKLGYREPKTGTMSIFLSANLKNPPAPLNSNTFLQSYPKASLYVKSFGGIAKKEGYANNIQALSEELIKLGLHFDHSFSACNIYDPPTKLSNCHNEVWFLATED